MGTVDEVCTDQWETDGVPSLGWKGQTNLKTTLKETAVVTETEMEYQFT